MNDLAGRFATLKEKDYKGAITEEDMYIGLRSQVPKVDGHVRSRRGLLMKEIICRVQGFMVEGDNRVMG